MKHPRPWKVKALIDPPEWAIRDAEGKIIATTHHREVAELLVAAVDDAHAALTDVVAQRDAATLRIRKAQSALAERCLLCDAKLPMHVGSCSVLKEPN